MLLSRNLVILMSHRSPTFSSEPLISKRSLIPHLRGWSRLYYTTSRLWTSANLRETLPRTSSSATIGTQQQSPSAIGNLTHFRSAWQPKGHRFEPGILHFAACGLAGVLRRAVFWGCLPSPCRFLRVILQLCAVSHASGTSAWSSTRGQVWGRRITNTEDEGVPGRASARRIPLGDSGPCEDRSVARDGSNPIHGANFPLFTSQLVSSYELIQRIRRRSSYRVGCCRRFCVVRRDCTFGGIGRHEMPPSERRSPADFSESAEVETA